MSGNSVNLKAGIRRILRHILFVALWTLNILPHTLLAQSGSYTIATLSRDISFVLNFDNTETFYMPAINNHSQVGGVVVWTATDEVPTPHFVFSCTAQIFPNNTVCVGNQTHVVVWDLNDQGTLAGSIETGGADGQFTARAAIFSQAFTNGYALLDASRGGVATKINSLGQAVGAQTVNAPNYYPMYVEALFWHADQSTPLGTLQAGDSSSAVSFNQRSEIVGFSEPGPWNSGFPTSWSAYRPGAHAFLWKNGILTNLNNLIPSNSGWVLNVATDINDQGQIVGVGTKAGHQAGFLYYRGTVIDLGLTGTNITVNAINQFGQIVGGVDGRAFIWERGIVRDLNDFLPPGSQWVLEKAADINDLGQVVGVGSLPAYLDLSTAYLSRSMFQLTPPSPPLPPSLTVSRQGINVILSWPTGVVGFGVESATNFVTGGWNTNYPLPVVVAGRYTVTNPITRPFMVYRLFMP